MHVISQEPAVVQSFLRNNKLQFSILTYLPCCGVKRVAVTFVEVSLVLGFCCWLTPITLTVLCVSTCSDGLLDFHMVAELV